MLLQTNADLLWQLTQLLDYLALPGPFIRWMPQPTSIPLRYVGVVGLRNDATTMAKVAARDAINVMVGSAAYAKYLDSGAVDQNGTLSAAFYIAQPCPQAAHGSTQLFQPLHVFALPPLPEGFNSYGSPDFLQRFNRWCDTSTAVLLSSSRAAQKVGVCTITEQQYGVGVGRESAELHLALFVELDEALQGIPLNGSYVRFQYQCIDTTSAGPHGSRNTRSWNSIPQIEPNLKAVWVLTCRLVT